MKWYVMVLICLVSAAGCAGTHQAPAAGGGKSADRQQSLTQAEVAGTVLGAMDRTADPCQDFYRYACGGWLDQTDIPSDQAAWTRSFSVLRERNREVVREIVEQAAQDPGNDPVQRMIGHFYRACMDEQAVERAGLAPLRPLFARIDGVQDAASLFTVTGELHRLFIGPLFDVQVIPDFEDPDLNIAFFFQGGLGMPDRDYYVSEDPTKQELMREYEKHVAHVFGLLGEEQSKADANARVVVAFETELAKVSRDRAAMREMETLYNRVEIEGLKKLTPDLPWDAYLKAVGYPNLKEISVATPEFFEALQGFVATTDTETLKTYLRWNVVNAKADQLPQAFVDANFEFYGKKISGQQEVKPRWKRCVAATEAALGEAVGKLYVDRMFAGSSKAVALEMIHDVKAAFEASLPSLTWMDPVTRGRAIEKVNAMGFKIGYPDEWRDYSAMKITPADHFANNLSASRFEFDREARKVGKPVDRKEWLMTPQMVNAYNHPLFNEMGYPAGILQPPFFHRDFPAAMNYGGIGGGVGHELTHGYDDQGRKFNPQGEMQEWWEPEVAEKFEARAQCVDDYYSSLEVEPGLNVNGRLTLGENIADLGGLKAAYEAYKLWEARHGTPQPIIDGLTNEQLLFVSWGQVWCTKQTPERARLQVTTDPHSPAQFRVSGPVSHNPAFARAFECAVSSPMRPAEQCVVW